MSGMRSITRLTVLAALVAASVSCGDVVRQDEPVCSS